MNITLSVENNKYILTGDVNQLVKNTRARLLLRSKFLYKQEDDKIIIENLQLQIQEINRILKLAASYIGSDIAYDTDVNEELADFKNSEDQFSEFSQKANNIKNNCCVKEDFQQFADVLKVGMTNRRLYPLQMLSAYHLAFSQNACNFSVPGAGKTSIVYGAYTYMKSLPQEDPQHVDKILIIGPLSSFGPWELEYKECFGREPLSQRINGSMTIENKKQYFYGSKTELTLISYQSVSPLVEHIQYYLRHNKVMLVLDEAHKIKNTAGGVHANAVMRLSDNAKSRVVLTGTPAPNGYEDVYNLFHFIWPHRDVINYSVGQLKDMSKNSSDTRVPQLMKNLSPFFIRIRKSDLNLPPAVENDPIIVEMSTTQRKIYDYIEKRFVEEAVENQVDGYLRSALLRAKMVRLQQAASNPSMLRVPLKQCLMEYDAEAAAIATEDSMIMDEVMKFYSDETPPKFEICLQLIRQLIDRGEKVIVWAMFIHNMEQFSKYLREHGIDNRILYGATPVANEDMDEELRQKTREGIVANFHEEDCPYKVIIANAFAVAESISLHKACHNAIYMERSFNCAHYMQSKDRIHRYGLPSDVITNYYYLLSEDSVDETISDRLYIKEQRMLDIMEKMPIPLFDNVTDDGDEDIKAIIEDYAKRKPREKH